MMSNKINNKRVKVGVALMPGENTGAMSTKYFEGVVEGTTQIGAQYFLILENNVIINIKYVQTIEIIG